MRSNKYLEAIIWVCDSQINSLCLELDEDAKDSNEIKELEIIKDDVAYQLEYGNELDDKMMYFRYKENKYIDNQMLSLYFNVN